MKPAANLEASSPIITFGKSHTLIDWQGDQAGSAKAANNLTGDCALFMPQSFSGSADSTQASSNCGLQERFCLQCIISFCSNTEPPFGA